MSKRGWSVVEATSTEVDVDVLSASLRLGGVFDAGADPDLDRWTGMLRRVTGAALVALCFPDASTRYVKSVGGPTASVVRLSACDSLEDHVVSLVEPDGSSEAFPVYAEASVTVDGQVMGQICMADRSRPSWSGDDLEALHQAAAGLSTEIALRLARREASRARQLVVSHNKVHELIAQASPVRDVLLAILDSVERYDPSIRPTILMLDSASSTLHSGLGRTLPPEYLAGIDGVVIGPNVGTCGAAAWSGQLTISENLAEDPKWAPIRDKAAACGLAHCWSMPISTPEGEVLGTLAFYGNRPRRPSAEHLTLLQDWARVAGIAIQRDRALGRLIRDARHDGLTGLPNRTAIFECLDEVIGRVTPDAGAAVLFVDLDGLKALNDTYGHDRADEMIREVAGRLTATVRPEDFVGRFGGDEFVVIAEGLPDPDEAAGALGLRLLDAISQPLPGADAIVVTASIGVAPLRNNDMDAREAIRESDTAMYQAKRSGRDRCFFFQGGQQGRAGRRLQLARELRGAELRGEMRLLFQPVVSLPTMDIVGVEALLRWTSPTLGEVAPTEFIPIAEDNGTIVPIGAWVLRESCETIARLSTLGYPLVCNVNVSARQVSHPDFALWVRQTLAHSEFPASCLGLEITETALLGPNALTTRTLLELDSLGVRIVLDDFGTGYSSLSWLKLHPFREVKIDRSFIAGLPHNRGDQAIVGGVIGMARAFGAVVTAEGVESEEQLAALRALGCDCAQGFLIARPLAATDLAALLLAQSLTTTAASPQ